MSVKTPDQFLDGLAKSKVLEEHQLKRAQEMSQGIGNVRDVARKLIKADLLTKWQAAKLLSGKTNLTIGKYRLLGQIGGASTGTVFLAEHAQMQRRVALKALVHRDHSPASTQAFLKQARAVSSLEHTNLTRAYDIDIQDQYYYLVLEFVQGRSIKEMLKEEGKIDPVTTAKYIRQAADALAYAHEKGLLHRDVRPANLMVTDDGTLKVLNLGVVKLSDPADVPPADSTNQSDLDHALYLSPEQARGSDTIDARSDIYSLGCIMFTMLTGEHPIEGKTYGEIVENHQSAAPKKILNLAPELSRDLAKICLKMLGKKRDERFKSAAQAVKFLDKWLESNDTAAAAKPAPAKPAAVVPMIEEPVEVVEEYDDGVIEEVEEYVEPVADVEEYVEEVEEIAEPVEAAAPEVAFEPQDDPFSIAVADKPAAAPVNEFSINTKAKPSATPAPDVAAAAPAAAAPAVASEAASASEPKAKGKVNLPLIIGGAAGAGILAIAGVVLLVMFLFGGDGDPVAQAPAENDPASVTEEPGTDDPTNEPDPNEAVPEPGVDEPASDDPAGENTDPAAEPPAEEPDAPIDLGNLLANNEPPAEENDPPAEEPAEPDQPAEEPAEDPALADEPPAEEPKENDPPAAEPKDKRTPAQIKEPLKQLVDRVALPEFSRKRGEPETEAIGVPVSLGKVFDPTDEAVFVDLVGADQVGREFEIERELPSAVDNRKWTIVLKSERAGSEPKRLAEMAIENFNFSMKWLPDAAEVTADANLLRSCMLVVIIGKHEKAVAMRTPTVLEPIEVNLTGRKAVGTIDVDALPDKESLMIEITKVEGFPPGANLPAGPFPADAGGAVISMGEPGKESLGFEITSNAARSKPTLTVIPKFKVLGQEAIYSPATWGQAMNTLSVQQAQGNEFVRQRNLQPQQKTVAEKRLEEINHAIMQLTQIKQIEQSMAESGKIHYRVLYTVGTHQIVVASTDGA